MEKYETIEVEIIEFEDADIITASDGTETPRENLRFSDDEEEE